MTIATVAYAFTRPDYDGAQHDLDCLHDAIMGALDTHFPTWGDAAKAWDAHRKITSEIEGHGAELIPAAETLRLALENDPAALAWASFLETATDAAQGVYALSPLGRGANGAQEPFGFSVKFNPAACGPADSAAPSVAPPLKTGPGR